MSLDFNYAECDRELLTDEHYRNTCETVVFNTMFVGMPLLTRQNVDEFIMRIMLLDAANGNLYGHTSNQWADIVYPWIGLRTNAELWTNARFYRKVKEASEYTMRSIRMAMADDKKGEL